MDFRTVERGHRKFGYNLTTLNLSHLLAIFYRAQFGENTDSGVSGVELDTVSAGGSGSNRYGSAPYVEQCRCPPGYTGLSCEQCAPGYDRDQGGESHLSGLWCNFDNIDIQYL